MATSELENPCPFLTGGELLCTTGIRDRTDDEWAALVAGLMAVPIAAVCFGIGLVRTEIPNGLLRAAESAGLIVLSSPVDVPFVKISHRVAERLFAEQYSRIEESVTIQDELLQGVLAGRDLPWLCNLLARRLGDDAVVEVLDEGGELVAASSTRLCGSDEPAPLSHTRPIKVGQRAIGHIRCRYVDLDLRLLAYAASILAIELSRRQAILSSQRELLGQTLEDAISRSISESEAWRRFRSSGIEPDQELRVIVALTANPVGFLEDKTLELFSAISSVSSSPRLTVVRENLVALVPAAEALEVAMVVHAEISALDRGVGVGLGGSHHGIRGLRTSYFEALAASRLGPGVHEASQLPLTTVLLGTVEPGVVEIASSILAPLARHDCEHGSYLVPTLEALAAKDRSVSEICTQLHIHRNTLRLT